MSTFAAVAAFKLGYCAEISGQVRSRDWMHPLTMIRTEWYCWKRMYSRHVLKVIAGLDDANGGCRLSLVALADPGSGLVDERISPLALHSASQSSRFGTNSSNASAAASSRTA
jgi:hypothetical protein